MTCRQSVAGLILSAILLLSAAPDAGASPQAAAAASCQAGSTLMRLADLAEASGLAVSRRTPGRLWTHNDSGQPILYALDERGTVTARVRVDGAAVEDWEALSIGPCAGGSCLFVADIGDNAANRRSITIYRIPEPAANEQSARVAATITAVYPDGAHDAEALFVTPDGAIIIVTKGETGPVSVYRAPANAGSRVTLERIGVPLLPKADAASRVTDAAISPDGQLVALRTTTGLTFYRAASFLKGQWQEASRVDLRPLREPQGEGLALGANNTVYLAGEGGGKGQAGTLARFTCAVQG
jgi:hypothetical protein